MPAAKLDKAIERLAAKDFHTPESLKYATMDDLTKGNTRQPLSDERSLFL